MPLLEEMLVHAQRSGDLGSSGTLAPARSHIVVAVARALTSLAAAFGEAHSRHMRVMNSVNLGSVGVDLTRENRVRKCKVCHGDPHEY